MIQLYPNEQFKEMEIEGTFRRRYAISTAGRLLSFVDEFQDGRLLNGSYADGYKVLRYKINRPDGTLYNKHVFFYKLVANAFIIRPSEQHLHIAHLDYIRDNDNINNLRWMTREEHLEHYRKSPNVIRAKKNLIEHNIKADGRKLTSTKVMLIKKLLNNPNRSTRIKMIAKQFGVSEMQIQRIRTGENWGHIKV